MPIIRIDIAAGFPAEQLQDLGTRVTQAAAEALGAPESSIRVLVNELDPELWFSGGQSLADKNRSAA